MIQAEPAQFSDGKITGLFNNPHNGLLQLANRASERRIRHGESIWLHPEKLLWIDTIKYVGVLTALLVPKLTQSDFSGRMVLGFRLNQTQRKRQYVLAPFDDNGNLGHVTHLHTPLSHIAFGRDGLTKKSYDSVGQSEVVSHIPHHHDTLQGIIEQVGGFTSDRHFQISFEAQGLQLKDTSVHGTLALVP